MKREREKMMIMKDSDHCENIDEHRKEMSINSLNTTDRLKHHYLHYQYFFMALW